LGFAFAATEIRALAFNNRLRTIVLNFKNATGILILKKLEIEESTSAAATQKQPGNLLGQSGSSLVRP